MSIIRWVCSLAVVTAVILSSTGCAIVSSAGVVGTKPVPLDAAQVEGDWVSAVRTLKQRGTITVTDAAAGTFRLAWTHEQNEPLLMDGWLRRVEGSEWQLATLAVKTDDGVRHVWGRVSLRTEGAIVFWAPDLEKFRALVKSGAWKGTMTSENDIALAEFDAEQLRALTSESQGVLYAWDKPGVYVRE